jgi:asparaginyl-tRNA synthetase
MNQLTKASNPLNAKMITTLKTRSKIIRTAREWFNKNNYIEVQTPIIIPSNKKWPGYLPIKIFNKNAHLAQGFQPYDQILVEKLDKIYTFAPTFRAEKTSTKTHLVEYWRIEVAQKTTVENIIRVQENLIEHICQTISKTTKNIPTTFKKALKRLEKVKAPFQKIPYEEAIQILQKQEVKIVWGQTIDKEAEKKLSNMFNQPFFITELPLNSQTFFYKTLKEKPQQTKSADLIAPQGYAELSSCAQRITNKKELEKKMREIEVNPKDQQWYLNLIKNSKAPQSGFALGFERLIQWICNLKDIKQTTPYPRTSKSIYP